VKFQFALNFEKYKRAKFSTRNSGRQHFDVEEIKVCTTQKQARESGDINALFQIKV
jgi:hypothetical protein